MYIVFKTLDDTVYACNIREWSVTNGTAVIELDHSEFETVELTRDESVVDGEPIIVMESTPSIHRYL